jgi:electron transport complex protein RnfD
MSKPKEYSHMTKDKLMLYTFVALIIIAVISAVSVWSTVNHDPMTQAELGWPLGYAILANCLVAVGVSVGIDILIAKTASDSQLNIMSAAVFGMIVALSYTIGIPGMVTTNTAEVLPLQAPSSLVWIALISTVGMVLFKKVMSLAGRKIVNPAAAAKLLVFLPLLLVILIPADHTAFMPTLVSPISAEDPASMGWNSFGGWLQSCFQNPASTAVTFSVNDVYNTMILQKFHGWAGGLSSIAVIIVGIALFALCRRYIKWRITASYLLITTLMALVMFAVYGGDPVMRIVFHLFIGSSIFLAFFMATDPASTPLTYNGQLIFGAGLAILTVLIQTYMNFFGGAILALIVMNILAPKLDKVGLLKPQTEKKEPKLPKAKAFAAEKVKLYECLRCGACMRVCCHKLSPILIKQAFDKQDYDALSKLHADYCTGCGHCTFVCPARIDLRKSILQAKAALRGQ